MSVTRTFSMPYRPSLSNKCAEMGSIGQWYDAAEKACHNGLYHTVTFNLRALKLKLPQRIVYGVSYNSDNHGPSPLGGTNAPEDSLNLALSPAATKGKQVFPGGMFWDTSYLGFTCGDAANGIGTASGFVPGVFNLDGPCNGTPNTHAGLVPAVKITPRCRSGQTRPLPPPLAVGGGQPARRRHRPRRDGRGGCERRSRPHRGL